MRISSSCCATVGVRTGSLHAVLGSTRWQVVTVATAGVNIYEDTAVNKTKALWGKWWLGTTRPLLKLIRASSCLFLHVIQQTHSPNY
jgi:hypothetical protein